MFQVQDKLIQDGTKTHEQVNIELALWQKEAEKKAASLLRNKPKF